MALSSLYGKRLYLPSGRADSTEALDAHTIRSVVNNLMHTADFSGRVLVSMRDTSGPNFLLSDFFADDEVSAVTVNAVLVPLTLRDDGTLCKIRYILRALCTGTSAKYVGVSIIPPDADPMNPSIYPTSTMSFSSGTTTESYHGEIEIPRSLTTAYATSVSVKTGSGSNMTSARVPMGQVCLWVSWNDDNSAQTFAAEDFWVSEFYG